MTIYRISGPDGNMLDANIELDSGSVVLHSRGGSTKGQPPRNTQYGEVLRLLIARLMDGRQSIDRVLIDSANARAKFPDPVRRILMESADIVKLGAPDDVAAEIGRRAKAFDQDPGTKGGNSTKQVRIETNLRPASLVSYLGLEVHEAGAPIVSRTQSKKDQRLPFDQQRLAGVTHIHDAVAWLLAGNDAANFAQSRDYDVVTDQGDLLAPKKIFGRALELAGVVAEATPYHFSAGWNQPSYQLIQAAGYAIVDKASSQAASALRKYVNANKAEIERAAASVTIDNEELSWIEGDKRMATHMRVERRRSSEAANEKRAAVRAANDGHLACERCDTDWYAVYGESIADAVFDVHHTIPLHQMNEGHKTKVSDLLCLCSNCHRAEHRKMANAKKEPQ